MRTNAVENSSDKNELMNESINQSIIQSIFCFIRTVHGFTLFFPVSVSSEFQECCIGMYTGSFSSRIKALAEISDGVWDLHPFSQCMKVNSSPSITPAKCMQVEK
jgi:hypothetical protein